MVATEKESERSIETLGSSYPHNLGLKNQRLGLCLDVGTSALDTLRAVDHSTDQRLGEIGLEKRNVTDVVKKTYLVLEEDKAYVCGREREIERRERFDCNVQRKT